MGPQREVPFGTLPGDVRQRSRARGRAGWGSDRVGAGRFDGGVTLTLPLRWVTLDAMARDVVEVELRDGSRALVRPIRPDDKERLRVGLAKL